MGTSLYDQYLEETGGPTKPPAPAPAPPVKPSSPIEDPWLRAPLAVPRDVTGQIRQPQPPGQPTVRAMRRPLDKTLPDYPTGQKNLETEPRLGDQPIQQMAHDLATGEGLFAPNKPAGVVADLSGAWPLRAGYQAGKASKEGHPIAAGVMTAAAALPVVGGKAGGVVRRLLKDVPFEAYSRLEAAVERAPFERGTAEQWKAALTPNVAAGERQFRGIDDLLEKNPGQVLTKAQLQQHLEANPIKIERSQYGGKVSNKPAEPLAWQDESRPGHDPMWTSETNAGPAAIVDYGGEGPQRFGVSVGSDDERFFSSREQAEEHAYNRHDHEGGQLGSNGIPIGWTVTDQPPRGRSGQQAIPGWYVIDPSGNVRSHWSTGDRPSALEDAKKMAGVAPEPAKFERYKQPGGQNYTESVLKLRRNSPKGLPEGYRVEKFPQEKEDIDYETWVQRGRPSLAQDTYHVLDPQGNPVPNTQWGNETEARLRGMHALQPKPFKQTGHFPDENPLVHHRTTDHVLPNGEKVRFIEELQSDWGQKARKKAVAEKTLPLLEKEYSDLSAKVTEGGPASLTPQEQLRYSQVKKDLSKTNYNLQELKDLPGSQPFQKTDEWVELAMKDIIDKARRDGIDRIAWATGEQNAAHYDLSKEVDRLTYDPSSGQLAAWKNGSNIHTGIYDPRALPDVIGKEAAEKLLATEPQSTWSPPGSHSRFHELKGKDLAVGGHGMREFYDEQLPTRVKAYAKKLGVKLDIEPVELWPKPTKKQYNPAGPDVPVGEATYRPSANASLHVLDEDTGEVRHDLFKQGAELLDQYSPEDVYPPPEGSGGLGHTELKQRLYQLQQQVDQGSNFHTVLEHQPSTVRDQIMDVLELDRVKEAGAAPHWELHPDSPAGFNDTTEITADTFERAEEVVRGMEEDSVDLGPDDAWLGGPPPSGLADLLHQMRRRMVSDGASADEVINELSPQDRSNVLGILEAKQGAVAPQAGNQSFSLKALPEGPQPLWAVGAAGAGTGLALQQGGDGKDKGGDLYKQFQAEQQKQQPQSLYDQYQAEQEAGKPKPSVWDRLKSINAGVRQALVPDALQQLETGASKFGKEQGEWGMQLSKDLAYIVDPKGTPPDKPPTEEDKAVARRILFALATVAVPAGARKLMEDWVIARGIKPPTLKAATPAGPERPAWDRSATAPPPVDQPQPLRPEQQVLRNRLATEGITPAGAITRRPPTAPPPVEPGPEAQTYSTRGAVRRPAAAAPPVESAAQPEAAPVERRADNPPDRVVWSPEERARYISDSQKAYAAKINKPWSQWTPEEKVGYFADQARVRAGAPWQEEVAAARQIVGDDEFSRRSIAAAAQLPPEQKLEAIKQTAHEIVAGSETAHYPPEPKPGDLRPVVSSNSEFEARPGVMRAVNKGEQPAALNSPLRLPEPTPEDRAIVQPKGYKEISPEEVAARKPAPVVEATPKAPQPATVDENGLFFEHRTPGGELRDFRRVSTEGLIKAHREMQDQIVRDQQAAIYRNVEADVSGTQYGQHINVGDRTERGTTYQAEAQQRLRNYQKVMDRLDEELASRGMSSENVYNAIQRQEEHEGALEQEAIHHADATDEADTAFGDFGDLEEGGGKKAPSNKGAKPESPISDVLNVAKLNLGSKTAEERMAAKLEEFRTQREANKQTFSEADVNRNEILNELRAGDPIALPTEKAKKLSGEELLARRDLVRENDQIIQGLSKRLEGAATPEEHQQAAELLQKAVAHNDALLSDLVTGSSQKGRDLNLLRRMAQQSLDPDVWRVQAKRMLGDRPLTAEVDAMIRKLLTEATDACG